MQKRYYDAEALFVIPDLPYLPKINGKSVFIPLPGAYLVCAVLFVNLFLGGIVRIRKGWKYAGVIIAHFSMISLLLAGFVAHHYSKEAGMFVYQGKISDYAQSYTDFTLEVCEIVNGERTAPVVIPTEYLYGMKEDQTRTVELPTLPFHIEVSNWMENSDLVRARPADTDAIDGLRLNWKKTVPTREENMAGCYVKVISQSDKDPSSSLLLWGANRDFVTATVEGKVYGFTLTKEVWKMPFRVRLDKSVGEYYPGTMKPRHFQSDITRLADDSEKHFIIKMNEPMRYGGYTLFQAHWNGQTQVPQSGFAIVTNPSDQWPKWSLYISILGLTIHFGMKLIDFVLASHRKHKRHAN